MGFRVCGVWSVECGVWRVECGVWSVECGVWSVECGVWSVECGVKAVAGTSCPRTLTPWDSHRKRSRGCTGFDGGGGDAVELIKERFVVIVVRVHPDSNPAPSESRQILVKRVKDLAGRCCFLQAPIAWCMMLTLPCLAPGPVALSGT